MGIIELFIKYFDHFREEATNLKFMETKMQINSKIESTFLNQVIKIIETLDFKKNFIFKSYEDIISLTNETERLNAVRTKQAYLILRLYNITIHNSFKIEKITIDNLRNVFNFPLGHPLTNECFKLYNENILFANNVILNRLDINKSTHFILMENAFPLNDESINFLF